MGNMFQKIEKVIRHSKAKKYIRRHEHISEDGVKYMYIDKGSDSLLIVFSGFTGDKRRYNYFTSLENVNINQLYILDSWGYLGSYYWYENGENTPELQVGELITKVITENNIHYFCTAGSSKGGTAAIYYGIKYGAREIYAGACQYLVGTYLNRPEHRQILCGMMASESEEGVGSLNEKIFHLLEEKANSTTSHINLFYSDKEPTYEREIIPLKKDLDKLGYIYSEQIEGFENHGDVGIYFPKYLLLKLNN